MAHRIGVDVDIDFSQGQKVDWVSRVRDWQTRFWGMGPFIIVNVLPVPNECTCGASLDDPLHNEKTCPHGHRRQPLRHIVGHHQYLQIAFARTDMRTRGLVKNASGDKFTGSYFKLV